MGSRYILKSLNFCSSEEIACAQLHADHGDILKDLKQLDDAAQSYKLAIQLDAKLSHAHVNLAVINHLQGECHQALRHYHEAYILDPKTNCCMKTCEIEAASLGWIRHLRKEEEARDL
ncbi:TPR_REGION domain-containing protein [Caerostris extrusa]|uniref:TPR_REGION domain-containing protein n=1 Tax=Caerostris extrusa TaxID=172846 RepID=A0AAV4M5M7_CAEEX|nr:TPR_REGION domain-containing protein [Caerostris extrusa]